MENNQLFTKNMKTTLRTLGTATLLSLAAFATSAQGQTNSETISVAPKNSSVKVTDHSTAQGVDVTLEGTSTSQKTTTSKVDKAEPAAVQPKASPEPSVEPVKESNKEAPKAAEEKKDATTPVVK